jgi:hypothetical protein
VPDLTYDQRVVWILRQNGIGPFQLKEQYAAYKDKRAAFEAGFGTVDEMTVLVTPGVAAMLDLEDQMLADFTAVQQAATEQASASFRCVLWSVLCDIALPCYAMAAVLVAIVLLVAIAHV